MSSTVKNISPVLTEIEITVSKDEVEQSASKMLGRISREAKVGGFRRGKVPRSVAKRLFGKAVYAELRGDLVSRYFLESVQEHGLNPIAEPDFEAEEVVEGSDYSFKVKIETAPRIEKLVTDGVSIERHKIVVDAEVVDGELERLRSSVATTKDLKRARKIRKGDAVKLELKREENGEWQEEPMPEQDIVLEKDICPPPLLKALVGAKKGEEVEVELGPETGKLKFLCKVTNHQERVLPELDDEFAKDIGEFDTLADLRADIEKRYRESLEKQEDERLKHALFDAVREKNPMEMPPTILAKQTEMMKAQFAGMMDKIADANKEIEDGDTSAPEKLDESSQEAAKDIVHQHFLIQEIARLEDLSVSDEDLDAEFAKMSESSGMPVPKLKAEYAKGGRTIDLKTGLLEGKVFDFLLPKVKINDIDPPAKKAGKKKQD